MSTKKDMAQNIVRLDDCEEEESGVMREARAGRDRKVIIRQPPIGEKER